MATGQPHLDFSGRGRLEAGVGGRSGLFLSREGPITGLAMFNPKSPCIACAREDRDHCAASCQDLARYRRALDLLDPDEAVRAKRARVLDLGADLLAHLAVEADQPS